MTIGSDCKAHKSLHCPNLGLWPQFSLELSGLSLLPALFIATWVYLLLVFTKSISVISCSTQLCQPFNEPWSHWQLSGVLIYCLKNVTITNFCEWFQSVFNHRMMKILQKIFCYLKNGDSSCKTITKRNFAISLPTQPFSECRNFLAVLLQSAWVKTDPLGWEFPVHCGTTLG